METLAFQKKKALEKVHSKKLEAVTQMENDETNDMHISLIRAAEPKQGFCNSGAQEFHKGKAVLVRNRSILEKGKSKILEAVTQMEDDDSENEISVPLITMAEPLQQFYKFESTYFIKSLWEMVEDPEIDSIISWSVTKDSVIIRNEHELCSSVLPRFFKHNNYSSFIRQLNKYGFKKMNQYAAIKDYTEYANEMFQGGKKHLLSSFKNRCNQGFRSSALNLEQSCSEAMLEHTEYENELFQRGQKHLSSSFKNRCNQGCSNSGLNLEQSCSETTLEQLKGDMSEINRKNVENDGKPKFDMDPSYLASKIEKLKSCTNTMKVEIMELRQQQESILSYLATTKEIINRCANDKQQKIRILLEKVFESRAFRDQFIQLIRGKRKLVTGQSSNKPRLDNLQNTDSLVMFNQVANEEEVITVETEVDKSVLDSAKYKGIPSEQQKANEAVELGNEEEVIPVQTEVDKSVSDPIECEGSPSEQQKAEEDVEWGNGENVNEEEAITAETEIDKSVSVEYEGSPSKQHKTEKATEWRNFDLQYMDWEPMIWDTMVEDLKFDRESQAKSELAKHLQEKVVYDDRKFSYF